MGCGGSFARSARWNRSIRRRAKPVFNKLAEPRFPRPQGVRDGREGKNVNKVGTVVGGTEEKGGGRGGWNPGWGGIDPAR